MAYHAHHMAALGDDYLDLLRRHVPSSDDTYFARGAIFVSSVTGTKVEAATVGYPQYWVRNLVQRVCYVSAIRATHAIRKYPRPLDSPDTQPMWRDIVDVEELPWLLDHRVSGNPGFPFAAYIDVAGEAIRQVNGPALGSGHRLRHVVATTTLILYVQGHRIVPMVKEIWDSYMVTSVPKH